MSAIDNFYDDEIGTWPDEDEEDLFSPDYCGPWCGDCWGGDGICMLEIERQAQEEEDYHSKYAIENVPCAICGAVLTLYEIPTDQLWVWPGDFYNPMIALQIFAVYDAPKGELHRSGNNVCHIWIGEGKYRDEKLIWLSK